MQHFNVKNNVVTIAPGTYVLGDPCYSFSHDTVTWSEFCKENNYKEKINIHSYDGKEALWCDTAYGDGTYRAMLNNVAKKSSVKLGVDAGVLGLVPINHVEYGSSYSQYNKLGVVIKLEKECFVTNVRGVIEIRTLDQNIPLVSIDTN